MNKVQSVHATDPGQRTHLGGGWRVHIDGIVIAAAALLMTVLYLSAYRRHPFHPHIAGPAGWWTWFDQERYFKAATAWSQGNLDPAAHWYLPGYPLMGAPFIRLLSVHAFVLPDLFCLLASMWLFSRLTGELAARLPHAPALGALLFMLVTTVSRLGLDIWVIPWSSTGATPFVYACLLGTVRFIREPRRPVFVFVSGFAAALVVAFRPTDVVPLVLTCAPGMAAALLCQWRGWRPLAAATLAGATGCALAFCALAAAYLPIYGFRLSDYVVNSSVMGFDWGLVPLNWVTLMLDPRPLLSSGQGIIEAFPWMVAGLAAFPVFLILRLPRSDRLQHATVILATLLQILAYMAYRDMHQEGLFRYWNYHYFKWTYPIFALYGALLLHALITESGRRLQISGLALAWLCILLPWRVRLQVTDMDPHALAVANPPSVDFESGLTSVRDGLLVAATGDWGTIYFGPQAMTIAGHAYAYFADFHTFPQSGGFLLMPLRPLPSGPAQLILKAGVVPDPAITPIHVRQEIRYGLPCWLPLDLSECSPQDLIPPPPFPANGNLLFNGAEGPFLSGEWSEQNDVSGRWTTGNLANIRVRLPIMAPTFALRISASAYVPSGSRPLDIRVLVNRHQVLAEQLSTGETVSLPATLSAATLDMKASQSTIITIKVANPRAPRDYDPGSGDPRQLGLFVRAISLVPLSEPR
jgi:hypothetical protein